MLRKNNHYSVEVKYQAVGDYLSGEGSLRAVSKKYGLRDTRQLRNWIKMYNGHTELKSYTGGSRMTKGRSTTYEERITLVKGALRTDMTTGKSQKSTKSGISRSTHGSRSTKKTENRP